MTDGTSQGLFIVVAIVIFGVFVALSHQVFGNTLTDSLHHLVHTAVTQEDTREWEEVEYTMSARQGDSNSEIIEYMGDGVHMRSTGLHGNGEGLMIHSSTFEPNNEYKLTFTVHRLDGNIGSVGGHLHFAHDNKVFADGRLLRRGYRSSNAYDNSKDSVDYVVYFDTEGMVRVDGRWWATDPYTSGYYNPMVTIVTNRSKNIGTIEEHEFKITDVTLEKVVNE